MNSHAMSTQQKIPMHRRTLMLQLFNLPKPKTNKTGHDENEQKRTTNMDAKRKETTTRRTQKNHRPTI